MDIQTDAASIVRYFHYDHKIVAKSILNIFKRHMKATPPSSLLHQLAADLELVRQDVVPLLQYAVVDRGLAMEPHVATAMAHLLGHLPNALSQSFETSGLFRKLARALCFNGHVELASSVFAWLEDIHEMLVPLELWTLFFSKTKRPIDHVLLEYEQHSSSAKQELRPAFDRFIAHMEHLNATSAPTTDGQLDEAVEAAMKAALHVGDMDTALAIQTTTSY
ncbi:hypothetical protein DYB38_004281 [Aphanomyces astaci]|uniref:Uncharacterized protein n=1 Tax=Aphanomyces astaci TaxID=112090 RepID=A0A397CFB3_APHAT|nr:hypothetical protein DYB38_004281 [Aphanomyces astaci]